MRRFVIFAAFVALSLVVVAGVTAQGTCSSFVTQALSQLSTACGNMQRNSACYGYNHVVATFSAPFTADAFSKPDDRVDLSALQSITTSPLDVQTSQWGIAVMKVQASLPDSLPGQAVTFLLLGDVQVKTGVTQGSDLKPMQAVYFTTGITGTKCTDAPQSSLIIQGPKNITVNLRVNGADVTLGSTAIFRSTPNSTMSCGVIDGEAHVGPDKVAIPAGFAARVPLDAQLNANGDWGGNQPIADDDAAQLQILKDIPDGVLNYDPDVPTPEEEGVLAALDQETVASLDPEVLRSLVSLLIADGDNAQVVSEWSKDTLNSFIADNAAQLNQATEEPSTTDSIEAGTEAPDNSTQAGTDSAPDEGS